jgi:hypothetical protein
MFSMVCGKELDRLVDTVHGCYSRVDLVFLNMVDNPIYVQQLC